MVSLRPQNQMMGMRLLETKILKIFHKITNNFHKISTKNRSFPCKNHKNYVLLHHYYAKTMKKSISNHQAPLRVSTPRKAFCTGTLSRLEGAFSDKVRKSFLNPFFHHFFVIFGVFCSIFGVFCSIFALSGCEKEPYSWLQKVVILSISAQELEEICQKTLAVGLPVR